ncbi:NAD(P)-binding protein [Pleomassaria siparia CBS 279.74]|uniref:NAD(P)-binding protein n=1 Tax=Pleomassaria siparia CBS 279.74 TaxID=1314801 RepID=A0A6G1JWA5_9PLEO|nr:NAD(P)-binding protein [Pleomassaria siparia CBS 279.74]
MAPKIFITGATGYIGGDTLYALYEKHPEYEYSVLVRSEEKGKTVTKAFPRVRVVIGGLDDAEVLEEESAKADVVIHTADSSDHEPAAKSIAKGLASGHSKEKPGFWLHTGGTGILCWEDMKYSRLGEHDDKEYNDWSGVSDLVNLPDEAFHRNVDTLVLDAANKYGDRVKTAIVCPPTIYGAGRGPINARSRQAYELAKFILEREQIPIIGSGKARWNTIHVADLADVYVLLTEAAVAKNTDAELWGSEKGYYLVEDGEHVWADIARSMGKKAVELGFVKKGIKEVQLDKEEAEKQAGFAAVSWGLNSRGKAERANKVLGWKPHRPSLEDTLDEILKGEKAALG